MEEKLLPLGSIVYLIEGTTKILIVGRGPVFESDGKDIYTNYIGVIYPSGINPEDAIFFNHEDIDKVVFKGYSDEEEERYVAIYNEWETNLNISKLKA